MEQAPRRLKRRREFLQVARAGRKWAAPGLVLQVLDRGTLTNKNASDTTVDRLKGQKGRKPGSPVKNDDIRVGFTVTRKIGGAVIRNRARRRLRAAAERIMPTHAAPGKDYVVIGRAKTIARPFDDLVNDLKTALHKLDAWREAGITENSSGFDEEQRNE